MHDELEVRLYARRVGTLTRSARNRLTFRYDETYVDQQGAAPLSTSMPVRSNAYGPERTEPWFNGLLAEGRRREHLARIAGAAGIDIWSLLHAAGGECAGAVQIVAAEHRDAPGLFHLDEERLATLLRETPIEPLASVSPAARISIAGAQEKVTLYRNEDGSWAVPTGGHPSTHILKPQAADFPSLVENEHWCMEIARRAGLATANTWIETIGAQRVLVIERYDRRRDPQCGIKRVHQEDMAQALGRRSKYQSDGGPSTYELFTVPGPSRDALFDQLMFSWLVGNCDAHAKNYSILEPGTPNARLAPIYDMLSTECYPGLDQRLATKIGHAENLNTVNRKAIEALGRRTGFRPGEATQRLHALAERTTRAVEQAEDEGLERGPIRTEQLFSRTEKLKKSENAPEARRDGPLVQPRGQKAATQAREQEAREGQAEQRTTRKEDAARPRRGTGQNDQGGIEQ